MSARLYRWPIGWIRDTRRARRGRLAERHDHGHIEAYVLAAFHNLKEQNFQPEPGKTARRPPWW
jgi:hypothetical protein